MAWCGFSIEANLLIRWKLFWRVALNKIRVWDLPTRLFHWSLVLCFIGLVVTGEVGGEALVWHFRLGYTVLTLLGFRMVWGVIGGHWSRFSTFVAGPATILQYVKGQAAPERSVGHNPLGALSVLGLLFFSLAQVTAGLFSDDEIASSGPLAKMVSGDWVSLATGYHTKVGKVVLIVLVLLHVGAIVFYRVKKRENLVSAMVHGDKEVPQVVKPSRDDIPARALAALVVVVCGGVVVWLVRWAG
jgi:cytochrome b